jgi:hypothetical protein
VEKFKVKAYDVFDKAGKSSAGPSEGVQVIGLLWPHPCQPANDQCKGNCGPHKFGVKALPQIPSRQRRWVQEDAKPHAINQDYWENEQKVKVEQGTKVD